MTNKKNIIFPLVMAIGIFFTGLISYASGADINTSKFETKTLDNSNFHAILNWKNVEIKWDPNAASFILDNDWKYWKIIRSSTNSNPVYPEDGYIKFDTNKTDFDSYVDNEPKLGVNYYRVCAIAWNIRYCSNVAKIEIIKTENTSINKVVKKTDDLKKNENKIKKIENTTNILSESQKKQLNKKLDSISEEKRSEIYNKLIKRIDELLEININKPKIITALLEIKVIVLDRITKIDSGNLIDDIFSWIDK